MSELCKHCHSTGDTMVVVIRHGERGSPWEESTIRRCANDDCWAIVEGTDADKLTWIGNVYDYKYFGDYPLSEEQLTAVYTAYGIAKESSSEVTRLTRELEEAKAGIATARRDVLEEAAKVAEGPADAWGDYPGGTPERDKIAAAIRALKEKP